MHIHVVITVQCKTEANEHNDYVLRPERLVVNLVYKA